MNRPSDRNSGKSQGNKSGELDVEHILVLRQTGGAIDSYGSETLYVVQASLYTSGESSPSRYNGAEDYTSK